jgi:hypothetical protein
VGFNVAAIRQKAGSVSSKNFGCDVAGTPGSAKAPRPISCVRVTVVFGSDSEDSLSHNAASGDCAEPTVRVAVTSAASTAVLIIGTHLQLRLTTYGVDRPRPSRPYATAPPTNSAPHVFVGVDISTDPHPIDRNCDWPQTAALDASARV